MNGSKVGLIFSLRNSALGISKGNPSYNHGLFLKLKYKLIAIENRKAVSVIKSVISGDIKKPNFSNKYWINEFGKSVSPNFLFKSQCQSVKKQYPKPYLKPSRNQDPKVSTTIHR